MMVPGPSEHGIQADVIFVIEGTAINGAYLNDLKTNYLIPTLEYFSQGSIEDREYVSESNTTLYGIVVYHAADCLPAPTTATLGPFSNPHKLLLTLDRLEMVGGKGESHANIGEGLATALLCFEDLQCCREPSAVYQKHCILVCNSPPYQTVVQESYKFAGHTVENLAALFQERNIILSILSPRKIPALFKLFEKAGGDLQTSQTKNYAKDPRHLVLLRNYNLKERSISPTINVSGTVHQTNSANSGGNSGGAQIPLSPLQSHDSPNTNQPGQNMAPNPQSQTPLNSAFRAQPPNNINSHQSVGAAVGAPINVGPMNVGRPTFNPQLGGPPNYHNAPTRASQPRWRTPFITPGGGAVPNNSQGSALIAQLTQPPSSLGLNVPFNQRMDGNGSVPTANSQQPPQQSQSQQQVTNQANQSPVGGQNPTQSQAPQGGALPPQSSAQAQSQSQNPTQGQPQVQTTSQGSQQNQQSQDQQSQQQQAQQQAGNQTNQSPVGGQNQTPSQAQQSQQQPPQVAPSQTQGQTQNPTQGQSQVQTSQAIQPNQQSQEQQSQAVTLQVIQNQPTTSTVQNQITPANPGQNVAGQVQNTVTAPSQQTSVNQQMSHNSPQVQGNVPTGSVQQIQQMGSTGRERPTIWQGILEWLEKAKNPSDSQKQTRQVPCQVSANTKDGEPELKADSWPHKLIMQLMPKQLIGSIGGAYLKNSKSVLFHPTPCEALDSLTKVMSTGFAGCVHFTSAPSVSTCDIKVLILLYTIEKRAYLGFIPNDQTAFVDRLRKVIQHQKTTQALLRQSQGATGPPAGANIPGAMPNPGGIAQGGILMSQTNTMAMGGGQITQNVVPGNNPQQALAANSASQSQMAIQAGALTSQQVGSNTPGIMVPQRPAFEGMDIARQQNLMKIHQLRQTLEAAQQQEAQYQQSQLDIHQNLEVAQQQEMQYKQQMEVQQAQKTLAATSAIAGQQSNTQRMMRPVMANNLGLRHLLQQQQPQQYRQVLGMQQQMVGPRGQIGTRPMAPTNPQSQQFDDVTNYDFLG